MTQRKTPHQAMMNCVFVHFTSNWVNSSNSQQPEKSSSQGGKEQRKNINSAKSPYDQAISLCRWWLWVNITMTDRFMDNFVKPPRQPIRNSKGKGYHIFIIILFIFFILWGITFFAGYAMNSLKWISVSLPVILIEFWKFWNGTVPLWF